MLSSGALSAANVRLGQNYPNPVVVAPEWSRHQREGKVIYLFFRFIIVYALQLKCDVTFRRAAMADEVTEFLKEGISEGLIFISRILEPKNKKYVFLWKYLSETLSKWQSTALFEFHLPS